MTLHEVELDLVLAHVKGHVDGAHKVFLVEVLVDDIAEPLGACLGGEGDGGIADGGHLVHELAGEGVGAEAGQGQADHIGIRPREEAVGQLVHLGVVADGQGGEGHLLIARGLEDGAALAVHHLGGLLTDGAVDHARLTEAAAADTAATHLYGDAILHRLDVGHDHLVGEGGLVQVLDDALGDGGGDVIVDGSIGLDGAVLVVGDGVEGGDVDALNGSRGLVEEGGAGIGALVLHLDVEADDLGEHLLALTDVEEVEEIRHGLGVVGAGAAADDEGTVLAAVSRAEGDFCQLQHIQHGGVAHLVLEGEAQEIEVRHGVAALQAGEGDVLLAHLLLHIHPGGIGALAPDIVVEVEAMVEDADAQVGHTDLVGIGEGEGEPRLDGGLILDDLPVLAAGVAAGAGDGGQQHALLVLIHDFAISLSFLLLCLWEGAAVGAGSAFGAEETRAERVLDSWESAAPPFVLGTERRSTQRSCHAATVAVVNRDSCPRAMATTEAVKPTANPSQLRP